jgi:NAD(P)-dependent dehydrogenase (short-subunit alcohol dehydrogenase family)
MAARQALAAAWVLNAVVAFLASDAARWITGQVIDASGGLFLGPRA